MYIYIYIHIYIHIYTYIYTLYITCVVYFGSICSLIPGKSHTLIFVTASLDSSCGTAYVQLILVHVVTLGYPAM